MQNANCKLQNAKCWQLADGDRSLRMLKPSGSLLPAPRSPLLRSGMTLIELLVVIVILTTIVAAAIPLLSPSNRGRIPQSDPQG